MTIATRVALAAIGVWLIAFGLSTPPDERATTFHGPGPITIPDGGTTQLVFTDAPTGELMRVSWPGGREYPRETDPITVSWQGKPVLRCGPVPAGCVVLGEEHDSGR